MKLNPKFGMMLFSCVFLLITTTACEEEEEEAELKFSTESVSDKGNVKIEYYSPDPCCIGKMYYITANSLSSDVTLKCENANSLFFRFITTVGNVGDDTDIHSQEIVGKTIESLSGDWRASIIDPNTVVISFDEISDASNYEHFTDCQGFSIYKETKDGIRSTHFEIIRLVNYKDSFR